jgi:hypothetical protein
MLEEFEDTKGVIRIRISKKNRQHNGTNLYFGYSAYVSCKRVVTSMHSKIVYLIRQHNLLRVSSVILHTYEC